ncbi:MAG: hypothetical protein LBG65_04330 [Puniceicoccales bacterium]|jgi:hypothetical protein|nr:hypothetical protein [Puniceicoccales bacterium]
MKNMLKQSLALERDEGGHMSRARFVADMRVALGATGTDSGSLTDLGSSRRLKLIYDMNTTDAAAYARWQADNEDKDLLHEFPCQELIRLEDRKNPRKWEEIWAANGGQFYDGHRMIARKDSPIWAKISRFGKPWPPFDFGSGMGLEDIDRFDAEDLGIIKPDDKVHPPQEDFNARLEASLLDPTPESLQDIDDLFGDQADVAHGKVRWNANLLSDFYDEALKEPRETKNKSTERTAIDLGKATKKTIETVRRVFGMDLTGWRLEIDLPHVRHAIRKHGEPNLTYKSSGEKNQRQVPLTREDFRAFPLVWRHADTAEKGELLPINGDTPPAGWPPTFRLQSNICGQLWVGEYYLDVKNKRLNFGTAFRLK